MALSSLFKRKAQADSEAPKTAATSVDGVQKIRTRTRQRLIGAVVLVTLGVIGFPLLFESQPRPIPVDIPIEVPPQDNSPALVLPAPKPDSGKAPLVPSVAPDETVIEASPVKEAASAAVALPVSASKPVAASPAASAERTAAGAAKTASEPASQVAAEARFVVQVGAFADPASARDIRLKLEKLGLKTYAQTVDTGAGKRTRVRIGPFTNRAEADKTAARVREAGVTPAVLKL